MTYGPMVPLVAYRGRRTDIPLMHIGYFTAVKLTSATPPKSGCESKPGFAGDYEDSCARRRTMIDSPMGTKAP
uniref:Uncharacterized protein n=1 Tax=Picea glauca TaxID=3330 RepID=A0A101M5K3_PICGL|nr:hypothetical protein ABT39_MTgene1247 [Picea glauca]